MGRGQKAPLLETEVPLELRGCFDFADQVWQKRCGNTHGYVARLCKDCGRRDYIQIGDIRMRLHGETFTGRCPHCHTKEICRLYGLKGPGKGAANPRWRGGRHINRDGYVRVWIGRPTRYTFEHRLVMAEVLGRPLRPDETVHHKNGDRQDNRPENLELWQQAPGHPRGIRAHEQHCPTCTCGRIRKSHMKL